jgi:hypothetical protein
MHGNDSRTKHNPTRVRLLFAAVVFAVWTVSGADQATAAILRFTADLSGANVRPVPTASNATGTMVMLYDTDTDTFDMEIEVFGLEGTYYPDGQWPVNPLMMMSGTHVHEGGPNTVSPFMLYMTVAGNWLNSDGNNNPMTGDWTYSATNQTMVLGGLDDLLSIGGYLNVHTFPPQGAEQDYRLGEIRGQIVLANAVPEPSGAILTLAGLLMVGLFARGADCLRGKR